MTSTALWNRWLMQTSRSRVLRNSNVHRSRTERWIASTSVWHKDQLSSSTPSSAAWLSSLWGIRAPKQGSGFDNFIPKKLGRLAESVRSGQKQDSGGSGGGGGNNNNNNNKNNRNNRNDDPSAWIAAGALLALLYFLNRGESAEGDVNPDDQRTLLSERDITWHDFLRLVEQQDVVKVLVSEERQSARVYLRQNAIGLAHGSRRSLTTQSAMTSDGDRRSGSDAFHDHDQLQGLESLSSAAASSSRETAGGRGYAPFYYRMQIGSVDAFERKLDDAQRALGREPSMDVPVQYVADNTVGRELLSTIPSFLAAALLYGLMRYMAGGAGAAGGRGGGIGGIFQVGKSTHKKINKEDIKVSFKDVAGCDEAKKEIMEFVDFLKDSERFTKLGAKIPKGALLCGPPGTGKTLLAKAVAGEAGVPFYSISGSDFVEIFVGVGPSRVRDLFSEARQNAPCIVFIDEIDAVGRQRGRSGGRNDERENTLNQLLVEMDGFEPSTGVVVLAGTNRVDILDSALTRPGRFDRQITVDKPDLKGRQEIFNVHLRGITLEDESEDIAGRLAGLTPGFSGADIANICNEAAIVAARRKGDKVSLDDFEKAIDRIIGGLESNKIMSMDERKIVAHHEAGHAVAGWFLEHADPVLKVTIIPRSSGALGFAQYLPKEVFLRTQDQIMDIVCMALAGRAAEEIFFGRVTTGASDDLKRVTDMIYSTIQLYGMNPRLGQLSFPKDPNAFFEERQYSEKTAKVMDEEARATVEAAYQRTLALIRDKKEEVEKVANLLLEKETITHDDLVSIIGKRPFKGDKLYEEYVRRRDKDREEHMEEVKKDQKESSLPEGLTPGLV